MSSEWDPVREFFDQWAFYRKIVDQNYLFHREAMEALGQWMDRTLSPGFTFLDMGCGDASFTSAVLQPRSPGGYLGLDLSPVALDLAKKNTASLSCTRDFRVGDFAKVIPGLNGQWDVIYVGLSFHHLQQTKGEFLAAVRARVAPGGFFVFFEPARRNKESREDYMDRWMLDARTNWSTLTEADLVAVEGHVTNFDFPETLADYDRLALEAGFDSVETLFRDRLDFYTVKAAAVSA